MKAPRTLDDNAFDTAVGERIRRYRLLAGLNQTELATAAGVTFQQVQKYEKGVNRVAASRLASIARALGVEAARLLGEGDEPANLGDGLRTEVSRLCAGYSRCSPEGRAAIQALVATLARTN